MNKIINFNIKFVANLLTTNVESQAGYMKYFLEFEHTHQLWLQGIRITHTLLVFRARRLSPVAMFPLPPFGITALTTLATGRVPLTRDCQTGELWSRLHRCDDLLSGGIKIKGAVSTSFGWCDSALRADH